MGAAVLLPLRNFGTRTANDSEANPLAVTNRYQVTSDGEVTYYTTQAGAPQIVEFKTDSSDPPGTVIAHDHGDWGAASFGKSFSVKKNDYWQITVAGGASVNNIKWLPIGAGVCIKQV